MKTSNIRQAPLLKHLCRPSLSFCPRRMTLTISHKDPVITSPGPPPPPIHHISAGYNRQKGRIGYGTVSGLILSEQNGIYGYIYSIYVEMIIIFCIYFISDYFTLLFMLFLVDFFECSMQTIILSTSTTVCPLT